MALSYALSEQEKQSMDLTDEQWEVLEPLTPEPPQRREDGRGRPSREDPSDDVLNSILCYIDGAFS